jgi:alpha-mannosidase
MFDAWNIDADFDKVFTKLDTADSVQLVESGPLRATIRVTRAWQNSKFVQDIVLYSGTDEVDVVNDIDWHETHILLKAAFDLAASSSMATYEIPYGTIQRPTTRNNSWEDAKFEVPAMVSMGSASSMNRSTAMTPLVTRCVSHCCAHPPIQIRMPTADIITSATRFIPMPVTGSGH